MKHSNNEAIEQLNNLRHSCAHLLAAAVMQLWPKTKRTIGPAIENGFYFDFDFGNVKISDEDFPKIEAKMQDLLPSWKGFEKHELIPEDAKKEYQDNPYKHELIDEFSSEGQKLTFYKSGNYWDLCRGGHVEEPDKKLKFFKLLKIAGAYWRGSEKNKMLTRIYGTCFPTQKELDHFLWQQEEAKKRDHRKLGKDLDLFVFSDLVGKGLPLLTPKGTTIKRILERFIVDEEIKRGYLHVSTPPIANVELYKTSGHYPYYKETMYPPMVVDNEELILRPMTCPHHFALFKSRLRSYHEMPIRFAEISPQFRYEKSGELTGLIRIRTFLLSDAHIITQRDKAEEEIKEVLNLISFVNKSFGLKAGIDYRFRLSLGDRKDAKKYYKDDKMWDMAENVLRKVLKNQDVPNFEAENEAAFYGPKIDVQMKNVNGKEDTAFTVQYDFVMPKRFSLRFINEKGKEEEPVVIHRASLGAFERTMAFLIEHYGGKFPLWLAPTQSVLIPIAERHIDYTDILRQKLFEAGIRVEIDSRSESMQAKIRDSALQKVPYIGIIGDREIEKSSISVRNRDGKDLGQINLSDFIDKLKSEIEKKN